MPRQVWIGALAAAVLLGGGYLLNARFQAKVHRGQDGQFHGITITPRDNPTGAAGLAPSLAGTSPQTVRIATFNLDGLDRNKLADLKINAVLVRLLSKFDVVALQGIRPGNRAVPSRLVDQINATGRQYAFATAGNAEDPASGFLFDQASLEIDHSLVEPVEDPQGRFAHRPLAAWFRVRLPDPNEAFTFKLVNVHTDPGRSAVELDLLDDVYRAVRDDGANEDDVILLGDFQTDTQRMDQFARILDLTWAIAETPTMVEGGRPVDNILFHRLATCEFTGRADVLDLMREFDLESTAAKQVSRHLPVWAEFRPYEGATLDHVANAGP